MGFAGIRAGPNYVQGLAYGGVADNATALQAALDAASANDVLTLPPERLGVSTVNVNKSLVIRGDDRHATFIVPLAQADCLRFNVGGGSLVSNVTLRDLWLAPTTNRTAGAAIHVGRLGFSTFENIRISNALGGTPYEGIRVGYGSDIFFKQIITQGCASHGCVLQPDSAASVIVEIWFDWLCQFRSGQGDGLHLLMDQVYSEGVCSLEGLHFYGQVYNNALAGIRVHATISGASPRNLHLFGTYDSNNGTSTTAAAIDGGIVIDGTVSGAEIRRVEIGLGAGWTSNNGNVGIYLQRVNDFTITGGQVRSNSKHGIDIQSSTKGYIDSVIVDNSRAADNTSYGLQIGGASTDITIASQFDNTDTSTSDQRGLNLGSSAAGIDWSKARFRNQETGTVPAINGGNAAGNTGLRTFPTGAASVSAVKTGAYTVEADVELVKCDTTSAGFTVTLPRAANFPGRIVRVKRTAGANTVTVAATAGTVETTSVTTTPVAHQSDGTNWVAI
jgi:hypothetical protein